AGQPRLPTSVHELSSVLSSRDFLLGTFFSGREARSAHLAPREPTMPLFGPPDRTLLVSICANLVKLRPRSGVGRRNTQADQREYAGFGALAFGSGYLRTVTLPTS